MVAMTTLVTGASGFAGAALIPELQRSGVAVRAFGRNEQRIRDCGTKPEEIAIGDAVSGEGLDAALDGIATAYFLIHSMEAGDDEFADRELRAAEHFSQAAAKAGVRRIIYLGVIAPSGGGGSAHVKSRVAVEDALAAGAPEFVALRASIAIAARSRSFRFLVRLVERVPVMPLPSWRENRTQPVDGRDVIATLAAAGLHPDLPGRRQLDIAGPEIVTYGELIDRIREAMLLDRPKISLPISMTPVASVVAAAIAGEDHGLIRPLMDGLSGDLLAEGESATELLGVRVHSLDSAIEHALGQWELVEELAAR